MGHHRTVPGQLSVTERPVALPPSEAGGNGYGQEKTFA
jgi:hypothetical protein